MYRITKGDITIEATTEAELAEAVKVLGTPNMLKPPTFEPVAAPAFVPYSHGAPFPDPALYGTAEAPMGTGELGEYYEAPEEKPEQTKLSIVPDVSGDVVDIGGAEQISVRRSQLHVLNAVLSFPDGVTAQGVCSLLSADYNRVGPRIQKLHKMGLVERIPRSLKWQATEKARHAKLVAS